jgi:hypothetical protein
MGKGGKAAKPAAAGASTAAEGSGGLAGASQVKVRHILCEKHSKVQSAVVVCAVLQQGSALSVCGTTEGVSECVCL